MAVRSLLGLVALATVPNSASAALVMGPNPIRKVTAVIEKMQKKVEQEGKQEEKLYEKFMCHCTKETGDLKKSVADRQKRFATLEPDLKAAESQKAQLEAEIKQAKADTATAQKAIADASAIREKEAAAFAKDAGEQTKTIEALKKAVKAISAGVASKAASFIQSSEAQEIRRLAISEDTLDDGARQEIMAFLQSDDEYAPASGEILGILKQMNEQAEKDLAKSQATEAAALKGFQSLSDAKNKEIKALATAIDSKTARIGELAVTIIQIKNDMADGARVLAEDQKFLADLETGCKTKTAEYDERVKARGQELLALADTIKMLTSDDALDLFKKTMKKPTPSFLQVSHVSSQKALMELHRTEHQRRHMNPLPLDFLALVLKGQKVDFSQVMKMIDDMVKNVKDEQADEDKKRTFCRKQLNLSADKNKELNNLVNDRDTSVNSEQKNLETVAEELKAIKKNLKKLDQDVKKATDLRQKENQEFQDLVNSNRAAMNLLAVAKERLNKFYNPAPAKQPSFLQGEQAPAQTTTPRPGRGQAPETFNGPYKKKNEESHGIIAMLDTIIGDLDKENFKAQNQEKDAQATYEKYVKDSAEKKGLDEKVLVKKVEEKARIEGSIADHQTGKKSHLRELSSLQITVTALHQECDVILADYDARKEARNEEVASLKRAKATLSGAKFGFSQVQAHTF